MTRRLALSRSMALFTTFLMANAAIPFGGVLAVGKPIVDMVERQKIKAARNTPEQRKPAKSRLLTAVEMKQRQGNAGTNPYLAGQSKWDVVYKGVNLMTGNFSTSSTDLSFEGGYGIPVNVTRSYSSNNGEEGPFGIGWTVSVDIRNTAGGLLKSARGPIRTVPVKFQERHSLQVDPNLAASSADPVEAVITQDAGGQPETIQKDVDGVLSTPPWDNNIINSEYEYVTWNGAQYRLLLRNTVKTIDGTVYQYEKMGDYGTAGTKPHDDSAATAEPANVLKPVSVTDRHGNVTTYTYSSSHWIQQVKANGTTNERPLLAVEMPNGDELAFTWGYDLQSVSTRDRVTSVTDGERVVSYTYDGSGRLASFTTPGGKATTYGYGTAAYTSGTTASNLLNSITDPRGLATTLVYGMSAVKLQPYNVALRGPTVTKMSFPNSTATHFWVGDVEAGMDYEYDFDPQPIQGFFEDQDVSSFDSNRTQNMGFVQCSTSTGANPTFTVTMSRSPFPTTWNNWNHGWDWSKKFDVVSQSLLEQENIVTSRSLTLGTTPPDLSEARLLPFLYHDIHRTKVITSSNFMGNPLSQKVTEVRQWFDGSNHSVSNRDEAEVQYAYWGKDKYFQQKAVKDQMGRISFTDYYTDAASTGKGLTYRVFAQKFTPNVPGNAGGSDAYVGDGLTNWRSQIAMESSYANSYAAQFTYDDKGRPTEVLKLQATTGSPWSYVKTKTTYDDSSAFKGRASQVVEDDGAGKLNRTTETRAYDYAGRAIDVVDGKGQRFVTEYDDDGRVLEVWRGNLTTKALIEEIVSYTYGTSGLTNGVVTSVTDGLSGVVQNFDYTTSSGGKGQVATVSESGGSNESYFTSYTYNAAGDRETMTYGQGSTTHFKWRYADYLSLGSPESSRRVFQTLAELDGTTPTAEQFWYGYDSAGRLKNATYAMTPQAGEDGYLFKLPSKRARANYTYDPGGRLTSVKNLWDTITYPSATPAISTTTILKNDCDYELTGNNRGLKTASRFYVKNSAETDWDLEWTETFGYEAERDYLAGFSTTDGLANASQTWSYDAAGNRNDVTVDNLNRILTGSGGFTYTHDILGNRTSHTVSGNVRIFEWDSLNRMLKRGVLNGIYSDYQYRADGMKVRRSGTQWGGNTQFRYDGQMLIEEERTNSAGGWGDTYRYGIGGRGVEVQRLMNSSGADVVSYPVYDAHGNRVASLAKSGSGYNISERKSFDPWGNLRMGTVGGSKHRYVGSLGHTTDDETGLVYMRARYYDPGRGRFVSEDPGRFGGNWFAYATNDPISKVDANGKVSVGARAALEAILGIVFGAYLEYSVQEASGNGFSGLRIALKGAEGVVLGLMLDTTALAIIKLWTVPATFGRLHPAAGVLGAAIATYMTTLLLALDFALLVGMEDAIDYVAPAP